MRNVSDKSCEENQNRHFMFSFFFPKILPFMRKNEKNTVEPEGPLRTIRSMRFACMIPKAKNTQSEYVTLTAFPLQQWLHKRSSMSRLYVHCLSCSFLWLTFTLAYLFPLSVPLVFNTITLNYNPRITLNKLVVSQSRYRRYWRKPRESWHDSRSVGRDTNMEHPRCRSQLLWTRGFSLFTQTASNRIFLAIPFMNSLRFPIVMQKSHELLFWMGRNWNDGWAVRIRWQNPSSILIEYSAVTWFILSM